MMRKREKTCLGLLAAVLLLAGCASSESVKKMTTETTAGTIDIVVENADGSQTVIKSERESQPAPASTEAASTESAPNETDAMSAVGDSAAEDGFISVGTVLCIAEDVHLRETPEGTVLGNCNYGDILQIDGERTEDGWVHVKSDVYGVGYIFQDFVQ